MKDLVLIFEPEWRLRKLGRMKIAAAIATTAIVGGVTAGVGAVSASSAADTQAKAAEDATAAANKTQMDMYNQTRADQAPYREAGYKALSDIQNQMSTQTGFATPFNFQADPGYQFTLGQGTQAINNSAAAKGGVLNGGTLKALANYSTGLANTTYGDAYSRYLAGRTEGYNEYAGLAGMGQTAVNATQQATTNAANQISNTQYNGITSAGNARASGYMGIGSAINSGLNSIAGAGNFYAGLQYMNGARSGATTANPRWSGDSYGD